MSDGPGDCARAAESKAKKLAKEKYPRLMVISTPNEAPKQGIVVLIYEEWLDHIVEVVKDRHVTVRWLVRPFKDEPSRMRISDIDWPVGYYKEHHRHGI